MELMQRQDIKNKTNSSRYEAWPDFWRGASFLSIIDHGMMKLMIGIAGIFSPFTMRVFMVIVAAVRLK